MTAPGVGVLVEASRSERAAERAGPAALNPRNSTRAINTMATPIERNLFVVFIGPYAFL
jgi:hypothetical protein